MAADMIADLGLRVGRENAPEIGRAFSGEASRMAERLREHGVRLVTEPALGDPASRDFAAALNARLVHGADSYLNRAGQYVDELRAVARQCAGLEWTVPRRTGARDAGGVGYHRYEGYPLEEKIAWVAETEGTRSLAAAQTALRALGKDLVESESALRGLVTRFGGTWFGSAGPTAVTAMVAATQLGSQLEAVERTRYGMPGAAPPAADVAGRDLFDVQTDFDERVLRRRAAEDEADRRLYLLESAARAHLAAVPGLAAAAQPPADPYRLERDALTGAGGLVVLNTSVLGDFHEGHGA